METLIEEFKESDKHLLHGFHCAEDGITFKRIEFKKLTFTQKCYITFVYIQRAQRMESLTGTNTGNKRKQRAAYSIKDFHGRYDFDIGLRVFQKWVANVGWMMENLHPPFRPDPEFKTTMIRNGTKYLDPVRVICAVTDLSGFWTFPIGVRCQNDCSWVFC